MPRLRMRGAILHSPYVFMARCLAKNRDNFTLTTLILQIPTWSTAPESLTILCDTTLMIMITVKAKGKVVPVTELNTTP
jgi:hypothetical protein